MLINNFLKSRTSIRDFKKKNVDPKSSQDIIQLLAEYNSDIDLVDYLWIEDGENLANALEGKAGYGGTMIHAPSYIAMHTKDESPQAYIRGAYYLEKLITTLQDFNLGSCWITVNELTVDERRNLFGIDSGNVLYLIGVGYPLAQAPIGEVKYSSRLSVEDLVFYKNLDQPMDLDRLEQMGMDDLFYYLRYAPSAKNKQPWRFVIDGAQVKLYIVDLTQSREYVEVGIVMYYFEEMAKKLRMKIKWELDIQDLEGPYTYIGKTSI